MPLPGVLLIVNMYNILLATGMGLMGLIVFGFEDVRRVVYCLCHAECGLRHGDGFQVCVRVKVSGRLEKLPRYLDSCALRPPHSHYSRQDCSQQIRMLTTSMMRIIR